MSRPHDCSRHGDWPCVNSYSTPAQRQSAPQIPANAFADAVTVKVDAILFDRNGNGWVDASDIGLAPGYWPGTIRVTSIYGVHAYRRTNRPMEDGGYSYLSSNACYRINVHND